MKVRTSGSGRLDICGPEEEGDVELLLWRCFIVVGRGTDAEREWCRSVEGM